MTHCVSCAAVRGNRIFVLGVLVLAGAIGLLAPGAPARAEEAEIAPSDAAPRLVALSDSGPVYLQPLDAPGNPYAGQYSDYDRWVYENARMMPEDELEIYFGDKDSEHYRALLADKPNNWRVLAALADARGYLLPQLQMWIVNSETSWRTVPKGWAIDKRAAISGLPDWQKRWSPDYIKVFAAGAFKEIETPETKQAWREYDVRCYQPLPAWLGQAPPVATILVPNGEYLCLGPMGQQVNAKLSELDRESSLGLFWYRYSPQGKLLGKYDLGERAFEVWQYLYWPQAQKTASAYSDQGYGIDEKEHVMVVLSEQSNANEQESLEAGNNILPELVACLDYDGTEIDPGIALSPMRMRQGYILSQSDVANLYAEQLRLGLTKPETDSPYAGLPSGPQVAGPGVINKQLIAVRSKFFWPGSLEMIEVKDGRSPHSVIVRSLTDPSNPYRDSYGPWDKWLMQRIDAVNPRQLERERIRQQTMDQVLARMQAEKREATDEERALIYGPILGFDPENDTWEQYSIPVDRDGWVIPLLVQDEMEATLLAPTAGNTPDLWTGLWSEYFYLHAGGTMPPVLAQRLAEARAGQKTRLETRLGILTNGGQQR